jgi:uncharacterized membrane protein
VNSSNLMQQDARPFVILICLIVFACVFIVYTAQILPDRVATHFGTGNEANGWMTRAGYVSFMLAFTVGIAGLLVFATGVLPARFPHWTNVPNRDYWLAPGRRAESFGYLAAHGRRLAYLVVMMMLGMHYSILIANQTQPPGLPGSIFTSILVSFVLALLWWIVRLYHRFPKPSK